MLPYDPARWYWLATDGRLFSSAAQSLVTSSDATYESWVSLGGRATVWPADDTGAQTTAALQDVLTPYGLSASLQAYAISKQQKIAAGGITVNVGTSGAPVNVPASTDVGSLTLLQGAATIASANPTQTFQWVPETGTPMTLTAAQMTALFAAVSSFLQATFATLAAVMSSITAGTVTTTTQVDAFAAPAWPANS